MPFPFSTFLSVSRHIPGQTVFVSHFPRFSVFSPYSRSNSVFVSFFTFFSFLAIFHVLECEFLIFHVFQFSRHNPGSIVCISHFSRFSSVSSHILGPTVCVSHFERFSLFLAIFQVLPSEFLIFLLCQCFFIFTIFQVL